MDLQIISNDISELQKNQATTVAKIVQYKRKLMDLSHRVLQVHASPLFTNPSLLPFFPSFGLPVCSRPWNPSFLLWQVLIKQEIQRKSGYAIQVDEEHLRVQLDTIQSELNAPTQFKVSISTL